MKIERDQSQRMWTLTSGPHVLYRGRRSPWEHPQLMREALEREQQLGGPEGRRTAHASGAGLPARTA